jgi:SAM-dependent methyltransferase
MTADPNTDVRSTVRTHYAAISTSTGACAPGCCGANPDASLALGYSEADLAALPDGANLGLGCGNPTAIAALSPGERVLDLGSGGGIDCFLAAKRVGHKGKVIGVDMTPEMLQRARAAAQRMKVENVEFRLGEIEHLPLADGSVDVILSNCVINLSPDKGQVFREAFRVLSKGGRLAISDVVATTSMPAALKAHGSALSGCVSGAATVADIQTMLQAAGFTNVRIDVKLESRAFIKDWLPGTGAENVVAAAVIEARKPLGSCCPPDCC